MSYLDIFFADDSTQGNPSRDRMGPLVGAGCIHVASEAVRDLERSLADLCAKTGFPAGDTGEFKWSPGRELWMRDNLVDEERRDFFLAALSLAGDHNVSATVVVVDSDCASAMPDSPTPAMDVTRLLLERVQWRLAKAGRTGTVVLDRPSGGRGQEDRFLRDCLETIAAGTDYVDMNRLAMNVVSTPSKLIRLLQLADLVAGASLAYIGGESVHSPPIWERLIGLLVKENGRVGGVGLKIHPLFKYANLYHWLGGDSHYQRRGVGHPLPEPTYPYGADPSTW